MTQRMRSWRNLLIAGLVVSGLGFTFATPAAADPASEGERSIVITTDQSRFGVLPVLPDYDIDVFGVPTEIEIAAFGGPQNPEITPWETTALSFDSVDRLYVALLSAPVSEAYACAIRLYDASGAPLGSALPVENPADGAEGLWPSSCEALALFDILAAYGVSIETGFGADSTERTHALVLLEDGTSVEINARTGTVISSSSLGEGESPFGVIEAIAISSGPGEVVGDAEIAVVTAYAILTEEALILAGQVGDELFTSALLFFPLDVVGAEFDSALDLWLVAQNPDGDGIVVLRFTIEELLELGGVFDPVAETTVRSQGILAAAAEADAVTDDILLSPTAGAGIIPLDGNSVASIGGIAIERLPVTLADDEEENETPTPPADDSEGTEPDLVSEGAPELVATGVVGGPMLVVGIAALAVVLALTGWGLRRRGVSSES